MMSEQQGTVLRTLREEAGLTQAQVAKLIGRDQSYVSKYENDQLKLRLPEIKRICRALRVNPEPVVRSMLG